MRVGWELCACVLLCVFVVTYVGGFFACVYYCYVRSGEPGCCSLLHACVGNFLHGY